MIQVQNLTKDFSLNKKQRRELGEEYKDSKTLRAVDDISFECRPGKIFGLLGPNGAGKTTTLRMIATMLIPTSGSISVSFPCLILQYDGLQNYAYPKHQIVYFSVSEK